MSIPSFTHRLPISCFSIAIASSFLALASFPVAAQVANFSTTEAASSAQQVPQPLISTPMPDDPNSSLLDAAESELLAQNLAGQCRQTRRLERIYSSADLAAARLRDVPTGTRLTLAGPVNQPDFGWIRISQPVTGFILTAFLVPCFSTPAPPPVPPPSPPTGPVIGCGIAQANLAINTQPNTQAFTIGGVSPGQGFRITGTRVTQTVPPIERGRIWTPIERFGIRGWISETGPGGFGQNIRLVPCASIGL
ncbi:MAG: hypothetical protein ACTS2F_07285 [Thainema sp.]